MKININWIKQSRAIIFGAGALIIGVLIFINNSNIETGTKFEKAADTLRIRLNAAEDIHQLAIEKESRMLYKEYCETLFEIWNEKEIKEKYHDSPVYRPEVVGLWKYLAQTIHSKRCPQVEERAPGLYYENIDWHKWNN